MNCNSYDGVPGPMLRVAGKTWFVYDQVLALNYGTCEGHYDMQFGAGAGQ